MDLQSIFTIFKMDCFARNKARSLTNDGLRSYNKLYAIEVNLIQPEMKAPLK